MKFTSSAKLNFTAVIASNLHPQNNQIIPTEKADDKIKANDQKNTYCVKYIASSLLSSNSKSSSQNKQTYTLNIEITMKLVMKLIIA